jgi:ADP-heptose:LPS heptosyltransferase
MLPATIPLLLPKYYVVIHCSSNEESRDWKAERWEELLNFFIDIKIPVLEIGLHSVIAAHPKNNHFYYDLTEIRSIQSIANIIRGASFFVGVDSAFAHLANALMIPGIVIIGRYRDFSLYMPYTGYYSNEEHLVRGDPGSAADILTSAVTERYLEMNKHNLGIRLRVLLTKINKILRSTYRTAHTWLLLCAMAGGAFSQVSIFCEGRECF